MQYIINENTGQFLFGAGDGINIDLFEGQIIINSNQPLLFDNPYYDFDKQIFYDKV